MSQSETPIRRLGVAQARRQFSSLLNEVFRGDVRVVVEKSGIPVAAIVPASELNEVKPADATIDQLELDRLLAELDRVIGSIPRSERQAAIRQALNGARQMRGDHESVSGSPTEFFGRMMEREDVRNLLTRLADQ